MKNILVTVYVLKFDQSFDIELPINLPMTDVVELLQNAIVELTNKAYQPSDNVKLYESTGGNLVNLNNIVKFSGITNGCKLLLV